MDNGRRIGAGEEDALRAIQGCDTVGIGFGGWENGELDGLAADLFDSLAGVCAFDADEGIRKAVMAAEVAHGAKGAQGGDSIGG